MEEVYTLHQHKNCVVIFLKSNEIDIDYFSTSTRDSQRYEEFITKDTFIAYDKQHKTILSWGDDSFNRCNNDNNSEIDTVKDIIIYDSFREKLYHIFKKDKNNWDQDDMFLLQAVSDFMRLLVEETIKESNENTKGTGTFHCVFVVPSEWEEEIREAIIRPIFVKANLISNKDHEDILLFCSDLEAMHYYYATSNEPLLPLERGKNTVICRVENPEENKVLIKLDLISALHPLFDFSDSLMFIKVIRSKSFSFTIDDIKNSINSLIKTRLPIDLQDKIIQKMEKRMTALHIDYEDGVYDILDTFFMEPLISDTSEWDLNQQQREFLESICVFNICSEIRKSLFNNLEYIFPDNHIKKYTIFSTIENCNFVTYDNMSLISWGEYILWNIKRSLNSKNIVHQDDRIIFFKSQTTMTGARKYALSATRNSDMYSKPCILPTNNLDSCPSIFLTSKPDAIMNIDITLESTLLSFSRLDENGLVKEIWNHKEFLTDSSLRSLGSFFSFAEATTLNVEYSFITFVKTYFASDTTYFADSKHKALQKFTFSHSGVKGDSLNKDITIEIEAILFGEKDIEESLISTQQQIYIKVFVQIYMGYISKVVSSKLSSIRESNVNMKIGYAITIESILLQRLFGTEDNLRDIIYASRMLCKDDSYKKLRIITRGEGLLPVVQQCLKLQFPIKSYFALAELHEDYVQLILNQVVTEEEDQEAIVVQDEIIPISNIYDSLFLNMWSKIVKGNNLIQLCDTHKKKDKLELLEIFSLKNKEKFKRNFECYISKQILKANSNLKYVDKSSIPFSVSCECRVCLTVNDTIEISFRPVLQDIISVVSTSLENIQFFGKYRNIQSLFYLIGFNYNPQFQPILMKILKDETNQFMYEHEIDTPHYIIPILSSHLSYPVLQQRQLLYKGFRVGVLHPVYSENFGFSFNPTSDKDQFVFKNKRSDTKTIPVFKETIFLLFKKGDKRSSSQTVRVFYLNAKKYSAHVGQIKYFKLKNIDCLSFDRTLCLEDTLEKTDGPFVHKFDPESFEDIPVKISIVYSPYSSSLSLDTDLVGKAIKGIGRKTYGEPMTLARF